MKVCTLLLLRRGDEILLAMKKRGFGKDKWNGVGGKVDPGETIDQAMIRECQEEINVTPLVFEKVALNTYHEFHDGQPAEVESHTYICSKWQGEPAESEEMAPQWFKLGDIPYKQMWSDDPYWLPQILAGQKVLGDFALDESDQVTTHRVTIVEGL